MNSNENPELTGRKTPWWIPIPALCIGLLTGFWSTLFPARVALQVRPPEAAPRSNAIAKKPAEHPGRLIYLANCARCHGVEGDGNGPEAASLAREARPRNFKSDDWKFDSRPETIQRVLSQGIPNTAMAAFGQTMSDPDRRNVADYLSSIATPAARVQNDHGQRNFLKSLVASSGWHWASGRISFDTALGNTDPAHPEITFGDLLKSNKRPASGLHLVQFWGVHCAVCLEKLPEIPEIKQKFDSYGFGFHLVCADEPDQKTVSNFLSGRGLKISSLTDKSNGFKLATDLSLLPVTLIIDHDGRMIARFTGVPNWNFERDFKR